MKYKKIQEVVNSYIFASFAVFIQIGVLQIVIMPLMAKYMPSAQYGLMLTIVAFISLIAITFGSTLSDVRLITKSNYESLNYEGDFRYLGLIYCTISVILSMLFFVYINRCISVSIIFIGIFALFAFCYSYSMVFVRLNRKYYIDIIASIIMVFGYVLGFYLFKILNNWVCIYIFGYMFGFIYYLYYCKNRFKESFSKTPLFHDTNKRFLILSGSSLIKQITTYADRFILYPLMGGEKVAIYYASTIIAKCIALAVNPLNSLILSYLNISNKANRKYLVITLLCGSIICFSGYWLCLIISKPLLDILYPQYVNEALKLIKITTCTAMLDTLVYFSNPFLLKIFKPSFQIMLNLVSILIYGLSALFLLPSNGVVGICYSALISSIIKVSIILLISLTKVGNILLS